MAMHDKTIRSGCFVPWTGTGRMLKICEHVVRGVGHARAQVPA